MFFSISEVLGKVAEFKSASRELVGEGLTDTLLIFSMYL
jgi:hypothetical protein